MKFHFFIEKQLFSLFPDISIVTYFSIWRIFNLDILLLCL